MKVLSLFDGISCGMVALERAGIPVERYVAYEIDKYAIQISKKNYIWCFIAGFFLFGHFFSWFNAVKFTNVASAAVLASLHRAQQHQRTGQRNDVGDEAACQRFDGAAHRQRYEQEYDLHGEKEEELFQVFLPDLVPAVPVDIRHRAAIKQEIAQFFHRPFLLSVRFRSFLCTLTSYCITQKKEMEVFISFFYSAAWYACR